MLEEGSISCQRWEFKLPKAGYGTLPLTFSWFHDFGSRDQNYAHHRTGRNPFAASILTKPFSPALQIMRTRESFL